MDFKHDFYEETYLRIHNLNKLNSKSLVCGKTWSNPSKTTQFIIYFYSSTINLILNGKFQSH